MMRPVPASPQSSKTSDRSRRKTQFQRPSIAQRLLLLSIVLVPLQQAFTVDVGFPLKPSEILIVSAAIMLPFQRVIAASISRSFWVLCGLMAVVVFSSSYQLLVGDPGGFIRGFTRSATVDIILYAGYAFLVVLLYSVGQGLTRESIGKAIIVSTWVMAFGVLIQLVLGSTGQNDLLEQLNFETKAKGLALDEQTTSGVMRSGPFVEGQHLGFYAAGCVLVALAFRKYTTAIVAILCLLYSQSTTGFISLVIGATVVLIVRPSVAIVWKFISAIFAAAVAFLSSDNLRTLINYQLAKLGIGDAANDFSGSNISLDLREVKSMIGFQIMGENPLMGVGPGRYGVHFFDHTDGFEIPDYYFTMDSHRAIAENAYAQIAAELGLLGLVAWVLLLFAVRPNLRRAKLPDIALWVSLVIGVGTQSNWTFLPIWVLILYLSTANQESKSGNSALGEEPHVDSEKISRAKLSRRSYARRKAYTAS